MIAAFNRRDQVVWGIGPTPAAALTDARAQLADKTPELQAEGLGRIEYAKLEPGAELDELADGYDLFTRLLLDSQSGEQAPAQMILDLPI